MPVLSPTDGLPALDNEQQYYLLQLAKRSIDMALRQHDEMPADLRNDVVFHQLGAVFVTLEKQKQLRGCIGSLSARRSLVSDVWFNAQAAAFHDPRFAPVTMQEWPHITISLSVLGTALALNVNSEQDLLEQLCPHQHGVIVEDGRHRATFLPQVWSHFADTEDFLDALRQKAGMDSAFNASQRYWVYRSLGIYESSNNRGRHSSE